MRRLTWFAAAFASIVQALGASQIDSRIQDRAEALLEGPCQAAAPDTDAPTRARALQDQVSAARARGDYAAAAGLQKARIRWRCGDHRAWARLASLLLRSGQEEAAVTALELAFDVGSNDVEHHLRGDWTGLDRLRDSETFLRSPLAGKLEAARAAHEVRLVAARQRLESSPRPPLPHITKEICPFECCTYGAWGVTDSTVLYEAVNSDKPIGTAAAGTTVGTLTGQVHVTEALPVLVVYGHDAHVAGGTVREKIIVEPDDFVFLLHYVGEGYSYAWHEGRVVTLESEDARDHCPHPAANCWGEHLAPVGELPAAVWWVEIRLPDGTTGWTRETSHFSGLDGCA